MANNHGRNQFRLELGVLVASSAVTSGGTKDFFEKYVKGLFARGIYTKIALLTGSHGKENGQDGMNFLECLSDANRQYDNQSETRHFYRRWCYFFGLPEEGEDPREFDPTTGQVTGIKNVVTPDWAVRKPERVPGDYKNLQQLQYCNLQLIDVAHYHGKPAELIAVIEKFQPSTLIIDWCFTRGGYTAQQLTASGSISQMILENEMSQIITGRGWIKLSDEQKKVVDDTELMEMTGDGSHHEGSINFLYGPYGGGKTVLGIEMGRRLRSRRQLKTDKQVQLQFCAPQQFALNLLQSMKDKFFNIEEVGFIKTMEDVFQYYQLEDYEYDEKILDTLDMIGQALTKSETQHVIIFDELQYNRDFSQMKKYQNVDMVFLAKAKDNGEKGIIPPKTETSVRVHELRTCYRQGLDSFMAHKYMNTHARKHYTLEDAAAMVSDDGERCPPGQRTVWINCKEGVKIVTILETVKNLLAEERKRTGGTEEEDCKDHVTVVSDYRGTKAGKNYCDAQGWTYIEDLYTIYGYEDEVIVILGSNRYSIYGEEFSRARRRTIIVTRPENEDVVAALSNWSVHTTTFSPSASKLWPFSKIKVKSPCKSYECCPFMGQMPELVKIDV